MKTIVNVQTGEVTTVPLTAEEIAEREAYERDVLPGLQWQSLRQRRDQLLAESDWTQSRDLNLANDTEWIAYRQALRDLPANTADPSNPAWPVKPVGS